jgi:hypothetical protein
MGQRAQYGAKGAIWGKGCNMGQRVQYGAKGVLCIGLKKMFNTCKNKN